MEIKNYFMYAYYNKENKLIAVLDKKTPQNIVEEYKNKYDGVEFE